MNEHTEDGREVNGENTLDMLRMIREMEVLSELIQRPSFIWKPGRELSLAWTKFQEARMWLEESQR